MLQLRLIPEKYSILRLNREDFSTRSLSDLLESFASLSTHDHCISSVTFTQDEISIVCQSNLLQAASKLDLREPRVESGWRCIQVIGPLAFNQVGVLHAITSPFKIAGISLFSISTFDTDYLLVKEFQLENALSALRKEGHTIHDEIAI